MSLTALWAASVAAADTQSGAQDPDVTVTVSLQSSGMDPNIANIGDRVRGSVSVKASNFFTGLFVNTFVSGDWTGTKLEVNKNKLLKLKPGKSWEWETRFRVRNRTIPGTFHLTAIAETFGGPATTCATILSGSCTTATISASGIGVDAGDESMEREENDEGDND